MSTNEEWLSQSRIKARGACGYAYKLEHIHKLVPRYTPRPLRRGTLVHKAYEVALKYAFYLANNRPSDLPMMLALGKQSCIDQQKEWVTSPQLQPWMTPELLADAEQLAVDAGEIFARSFQKLGVHEGRWTTVADKNGEPMIEYPMSVEHPDWAGIRGTADWVAREQGTGHVWLWDFKTRKVLQSEEHDRLQLQHPTYLQLLRITQGLDLVGAATYQIRAETRKWPTLLKTGKMSRAACRTDWETYKLALKAAGLREEDYADMKDSGKLSEFDRTAFYHWTPEAVDNAFDSSFLVSAEMLTHEHNLYAYSPTIDPAVFPRNLNPHTCRGCKYRTYCEADIRGEDTDYLARTQYMREGDVMMPPMKLELLSDD